ncbi:MAG: hypothetical protein LBT92_00325 [Rickettsiales bacterium]|jgi:hypothetical protein|nr:hypothetical protein [Rickettsiales bacterium]
MSKLPGRKISDFEKKTGRQGSEHFIKLPYNIAESPAYRTLSPSARSIMTAIQYRYNGYNNGQIGFACSSGEKWGICPNTTQKALTELYEHGFIIPFKKGMRLGRKASEWALTFERLNNQPPTNDWKRFDEKQKIIPNLAPYNTKI